MKIDDMKNIIIPKDFGSNEYCGMTSPINTLQEQLDNTVSTDWGASKFVILSNDWQDYVIKIPFNGGFWSEEHLTKEKQKSSIYYEEDNLYFRPFIIDYCKEEEIIYNKAKKRNLECFFAATLYRGKTANGHPYYVSEKVLPLENDYFTFTEKDVRKSSLKKAKSAMVTINNIWLGLAYDFYGDKMVEDFLSFVEMHDINDLTCDNIGYRDDGEPVLLDYSGYWY